MSEYPVMRGSRSGDPHPTLRLAALTAVIAGVILVAAAAFLLSYEGIHQIALRAGVSPTLARLYPLMFDAMLVIACAATLALRNAGWGSRLYVWVSLLLLVAAVAVGDALHATGVGLTGQPARAVIAIIPWVLLLIGFGIWLVMLRQWRRSRAMAAAADRDRAGQAAAGGAAAVSWAGARGAAPARTGGPRTGLDALMGRPPAQAPEQPPAVESPAAGNRAIAEGQPGRDPGQAGRDPGQAGPGAARDDGKDMPAGAVTEGGVTFEALPAGAAAGPRAPAAGAVPRGNGETHEAATRAGAGDQAGTSPGDQAGTSPGDQAGTSPGDQAGTSPGDQADTSPMAPSPASVPHFDRPRSTPTPPQDAGAGGE